MKYSDIFVALKYIRQIIKMKVKLRCLADCVDEFSNRFQMIYAISNWLLATGLTVLTI